MAVIEFQICIGVRTKFHQNWMIFRWYVVILRFAIWRLSAILNFWNLEFMSRDFYRHAVLLPCARFHEIGESGRRLPSWILKIFRFGHVTVAEFQICICVPKFIKIGWFFVEMWWFHDSQDGGSPPSWNSWNRHISTKNHLILMKFGTWMQIWNSMTARDQIWEFFKIQDGGRPLF